MTDYGVTIDGIHQYDGRMPDGRIKVSLGGKLLTKECAENLARLLRLKHKSARVVELTRSGEDYPAIESIQQLGETLPVNAVYSAVRDALRFGDSKEEILATVQKALNES